MRFLVDECLHESLVGVAHGAGFEATHVNHLGLSGKPDWELADRIVKDEPRLFNKINQLEGANGTRNL
jgi:predicted nuclease of predicted toxin-antitoxin system